jgi:hypothetical protein
MYKSMTKNPGLAFFVTSVALMALVAINTVLIMLIWNNILIKKVKGADFQKLNFWDALAIGVFLSIVSGGTTVISKCNK